MTVWITDDENKVPVHVETPILVGSVRKVKICTNGEKIKYYFLFST